MDISSVKMVERELAILNPEDNSETGLVLKVVSAKDKRVKKAVRKAADVALSGEEMTDEQEEKSAVDILASAVVGWEWQGDASYKGEKLKFTPENVKTVLAAEWIREQLDREVSRTKLFFKSSPDSSKAIST